MPAVFLVESLAKRLGQHTCFAPATQLRFQTVGGGSQFAAKLQVIVPAIAIEATVIKRGAHSTARLTEMAAIAEATALRKLIDVAKLVAI